jgi:hypothetical protein
MFQTAERVQSVNQIKIPSTQGFKIKPNTSFVIKSSPLWYQALVGVNIPDLDINQKEILNGVPTDFYSLAISKDAENWAGLLNFSLKYNLLPERDVNAFIDTPIASVEQLKAGSSMCDKVLSNLSPIVANIKKETHGYFEDLIINNGVFSNISSWVDSSFSPTLTLGNIGEYGGTDDELSLRLEIGGFLTALSLPEKFCNFPAPLKLIIVQLVSLMANEAQMRTSIDILTMNYDQCEFGCELDKISHNELSSISTMDEEDLAPYLAKKHPKLTEGLTDYYGDLDYAIKYVYEMIEAKFLLETPWMKNLSPEALEDINGTLTSFNDIITSWGEQSNPLYGHPATYKVKGIIDVLLCHYQFVDNDANAVCESDVPLSEFRAFGLGLSLEYDAFNEHNEHISSSGESGTITIKFDAPEPLKYIKNFILFESAALFLVSALSEI